MPKGRVQRDFFCRTWLEDGEAREWHPGLNKISVKAWCVRKVWYQGNLNVCVCVFCLSVVYKPS